MRVGLLIGLLFILVETAVSQCSPISSCQIPLVSTGPLKVKFYMYTPASYQIDNPASLLVSLHGIGQIGNDSSILIKQASDATPAYLISQNRWPSSRPFIVVSPQLKPDGSGLNQDWRADVIDEVVEYVKTLRNIDTNRIYLTGLSLGGQGAMIYTMAHPNKVAAMIAMANRTDEIIQNACLLVGKPLWMFHGTEDTTVPYSNSINMYNNILACSNPTNIKPELTTVNAGRHDIWNSIYNLTAGFDIYSWLLQYSLNDLSNKMPYVSAGQDRRFLQNSTIYLQGHAFDSDGTISSIQWTQLTGEPLVLSNTTTTAPTILNPPVGTFSFRLTVTDNTGLQNSDEITITIAATRGAIHAVTDFTLYNAFNNSVIGNLADGMVLNKNLMGVTDFNVLATSTNGGFGGNHVRFSINQHSNIRTITAFTPSQIFIINPTPVTIPPQQPQQEWRIPVGDQLVCATPVSGDAVQGTLGFTKCLKLMVYDQPIKQFYSKAGQDLSLLSSWAANPDGTGAAPESFTGAFQIFNVQTAAQQNQILNIGGIETFMWIRNGGEFTINNNFTGVVNIEGNGIVNINTNQPVVFGSVAPTATIRFGATATQIPSAAYGHVVLQGSAKILPAGTVTIAGNLITENGATLNGSLTGTSTLQVAGNVSFAETLNPTRKFNLELTGTGTQQNITLAPHAAFNQVTLRAGVVGVLANLAATLEVGGAAGGGLTLENNSELVLNKHTLTVSGAGAIYLAPTAHIGFSKGNLFYNSTNTNSALRSKAGADSIQALLVNAGQLSISNSLFVLDSVKVTNGILHSNRITLVSTAAGTARIAAFEGTGNLTGSVTFQRYIRPGRMYRYLAFPVNGISVDSLQEYLPVTGNFIGASKGSGLNSTAPSLFRFANNQWLPYPTTDSTALFSIGTGYSVFLRNESEPVTLQATGPIHRGDFVFTLQPGSSGENDGWNLLGNPYAAPVQWGNWNSAGVNNTVHVRNNESENDDFLIWNGSTGDPEFAGKIAPGQSFWVKSLTATPTLTATESGKTNTGDFFRTAKIPKPTLTLTLQKGNSMDRAFLEYDEDASTAFNAATDAHKLKNTRHSLSIIATDSVAVAIKSMPDGCESLIELDLHGVMPGNYTLSLGGTAMNHARLFELTDRFTATTTTVTAITPYAFNVTTAGESYGKRFSLITRSTLTIPAVTQRGDTLFSSAKTNQWLLNGEPIPGATQAYLIATNTGTYQTEAQQGGCRKQSDPFIFVVTSIKQEPFTLHPNPAQDQIFVNGLTHPTPFTIYDLHGKSLQAGTLSPDQNQIDLKLTSWVYILTVHHIRTHRIKLIVK